MKEIDTKSKQKSNPDGLPFHLVYQCILMLLCSFCLEAQISVEGIVTD